MALPSTFETPAFRPADPVSLNFGLKRHSTIGPNCARYASESPPPISASSPPTQRGDVLVSGLAARPRVHRNCVPKLYEPSTCNMWLPVPQWFHCAEPTTPLPDSAPTSRGS